MAPRAVRPLVERRQELETLHAAIRDAQAGRPSVTFVRGEAGIGKSSLVRELAEDGTALALRGDCFQIEDAELPFAPLAAALRDVPAPTLADASKRVSPAARRQLARTFPHALADGGQAEEPDSDRHAQRQLFDALLSLLGELGRAAPLLLAIDDFQWVDRSTRDFTGFLARGLRRERLAVVVTYRTDALPPRHPTAELVAGLARVPAVGFLDLGPLSAEGVASHARNLIGPRARPGLVDEVYRRSQGNPFFVEELLAAHVEGRGDEVPAGVLTAAIPGSVSAAAQGVLEVVAGVGRPLSWELLQAACGLEPDALRRAVREALEHRLLTEEGGAFAFRHVLVREAIYGGLHAGERRALHLTIAQSLSRGGHGGHAELAFHWSEAGCRPEALEAAVAAGLEAERARGFAAAARHLEMSIRLWDELGAAPAGLALDRIELLGRLSDARKRAGDYRGAAAACERALAAIDPARDPLRAAAFHERLGALSSMRSDVALECFRRALALLPADQPARRARLVGEEASALWGLDRWEEACARAREAGELADRAGAQPESFYARTVLGLALAFAGRREEGEDCLRTALERGGGALPDDRLRAYLHLGEVRRMRGHFDAARQAMDRGAALADELGLQGAFGWYMTVNAAGDLLALGRWAQADELLERVRYRPLEEWAEIQLRQVAGGLALARDRIDEAWVELDRARELIAHGAPEFVPPVYAALAELALATDGPERARALVGEGLAAVESKTELLYTPALHAVGARVEADAAVAAMDARERIAAEEACDAAGRLASVLAARLGEVGDPPPTAGAHLASCQAEVRRAQAQLARRTPDEATLAWSRAAESWAAAVAAWSALEAPYPAAYATWRRAEAVLASAGRRSEGPALLRSAREQADRLGATRLAAAIEALAQRAGVGLGSDASAHAPRDSAHGLTARELDVLALLVEGKTNREIAAELVISLRTAETHVSRVLSKLNASNRTEATAAAHRLGIEPRLSGRRG